MVLIKMQLILSRLLYIFKPLVFPDRHYLRLMLDQTLSLLKIVQQKCVTLGTPLEQADSPVEFSFKLCHGNHTICDAQVTIRSLFNKKQGWGNRDVEASCTVTIPADINGLDLPAVFIDEIAENSGLLFTKTASGTDEKEQGMISAGEIDCLEYFIILYADSCGDARSCRWIDMIHIKEFTIFLGDIHGSVSVGEGFSSGDILHGQIFQDVLLGWSLNSFFLQDIEQLLKIIRLHIPQIIDRVPVKRWRWI